MTLFPIDVSWIFGILVRVINNIDTLITFIPISLQLVGIISWIWNGIFLFNERKAKERASGFFRATLAWMIGKGLEYFLLIIYQ